MQAKRLNDLIKVYDDVIDVDTCKEIINVFDTHEDYQNRIDREARPNFTDFNLTVFTESNDATAQEKQIHKFITNSFMSVIGLYSVDQLITDELPAQYALEQIRIKKYSPGGVDRYDEHVDVGNYNSARRYLAFFLYLNDIDERGAGGTKFPYLDLTVQPKAGRVLVFPPLWMFPHSGLAPIEEPKYIVGSYCHYI
jgi:hypothetical protein